MNFPSIVITLAGTGLGGSGGVSRITMGGGVRGRFGNWRMMSGGAGGICLPGFTWITMSPGGGGNGGFKSLFYVKNKLL
jgi:hypothetical protein